MSDGAKLQWSLLLLLVVDQSWFITGQLYEYHYIKEKKNWTEAQEYCRHKYTDLATISNMTDMERLKKSAKNQQESAWIGLHSLNNTNGTWRWSLPGLEFNESEKKWDEGEPNGQNCGGLKKNLKWLDISCDENRSFICYDERKTQRFHFPQQRMNWSEAQRHCRENHTDLASGPEQLNDTELHSLAENNSNDWYDVFIGLFRDTWSWSDGSSFSFRHWNNLAGITTKEDRCAVMKEDGEWETDDCSKDKRFFCYDDKVILVKLNLTWEDALYYCRENHRDLVSITDLNDQRWVQERVKNATTEFVWTGLRYTCTLDFWFWVGGEVVTYHNVDSGEKGDRCDMSGAMQRAGKHKWFKINDMQEFNFLCSEW
ncbi:macrophage mannose receptor 1-like [Cololabis saira]|uniref:macrophage mannose receptor 1-like n=1 Tax=Cololabis saira TaxID=129043 RepID=UPI002AD27307|nr:macrophage mannose receptor 1-like [Cololabis saira]XP_061566040.1 macrophage mannose receptor 1-like [Cololabis saira]